MDVSGDRSEPPLELFGAYPSKESEDFACKTAGFLHKKGKASGFAYGAAEAYLIMKEIGILKRLPTSYIIIKL